MIKYRVDLIKGQGPASWLAALVPVSPVPCRQTLTRRCSIKLPDWTFWCRVVTWQILYRPAIGQQDAARYDMFEMYCSSSEILLLLKFIIELNITPASLLYTRSVSPWLLPPLECLCLPPPPPVPGPGPPPCLHMSHSHPFLTPCTSRKLCHMSGNGSLLEFLNFDISTFFLFAKIPCSS